MTTRFVQPSYDGTPAPNALSHMPLCFPFRVRVPTGLPRASDTLSTGPHHENLRQGVVPSSECAARRAGCRDSSSIQIRYVQSVAELGIEPSSRFSQHALPRPTLAVVRARASVGALGVHTDDRCPLRTEVDSIGRRERVMIPSPGVSGS